MQTLTKHVHKISSVVVVLLVTLFISFSPAQAQTEGERCTTVGQRSSGLICLTIPRELEPVFNRTGNVWILESRAGEYAEQFGLTGNTGENSGGGMQLDILGQAAQTLPGVPDGAASANPSAAFGAWIARLLNIILVVAVLAVFLYLIWGGFDWITSAGDKGKLESARNRMTQAVIGLIVLAASTAILILVQDFLNICVIQIGTSCTNWT